MIDSIRCLIQINVLSILTLIIIPDFIPVRIGKGPATANDLNQINGNVKAEIIPVGIGENIDTCTVRMQVRSFKRTSCGESKGPVFCFIFIPTREVTYLKTDSS